ncbi:uncharacterized protein LOC144146931 [Haemaphysalis longicornis]
MILWHILLTTASTALFVSGHSVHRSRREESERRQWQLDIERLQSPMQQWFQNAFNENQLRRMMNPFEGVFNISSMMDMLRGTLPPRGSQGILSATVQRSAQRESSPLNYSGRRISIEGSPGDNRASLPPPPGEASVSQSRYLAHLAAQFATDQGTRDSQYHSGPSPPIRDIPGLFQNSPGGTGRPRRGRQQPSWLLPGQRGQSDFSSEESRESREDFLPGGDQARPGGSPRRRVLGWDRGSWNRRFLGPFLPGLISSEESQPGQDRNSSKRGGRGRPFPRGFSPFPPFSRSPGTPGQQDQDSPATVPPGLGEYSPEDFFGQRRVNKTPLDQTSDWERFPGQRPRDQGPPGQSRSRQGRATSSRSEAGTSPWQISAVESFRGHIQPAG